MKNVKLIFLKNQPCVVTEPMNMVYENNDIRLVNYNTKSSYDLTNLNIYISDKYRKYDVYLCVRNIKSDVFASFKLTKTDNSNDFQIYSIELKQSYKKLYDGEVIVKLLFVNPYKEKIFFSKEINMNLIFSSFKIASNLFNSGDIHQEILEMYDKVTKITNMNINIHKEMAEMLNELKGGGNK